MRIYKALLKYGYAEFRLEILEYCSPEVLIKREQFYFDTLNPEYNTLKIAGSPLPLYFLQKISSMKFFAKNLGDPWVP
jgi:group I intron endonuclease